jgi:hypothetical protein
MQISEKFMERLSGRYLHGGKMAGCGLSAPAIWHTSRRREFPRWRFLEVARNVSYRPEGAKNISPGQSVAAKAASDALGLGFQAAQSPEGAVQEFEALLRPFRAL